MNVLDIRDAISHHSSRQVTGSPRLILFHGHSPDFEAARTV